jgi:hypothetical protein
MQVYQNIAPDRFDRIAAAVQARTGIAVSGDVGEASAKGITISWTYYPQTQTLTVTLVRRIPLIDPSQATILADIDALVGATP